MRACACILLLLLLFITLVPSGCSILVVFLSFLFVCFVFSLFLVDAYVSASHGGKVVMREVQKSKRGEILCVDVPMPTGMLEQRPSDSRMLEQHPPSGSRMPR